MAQNIIDTGNVANDGTGAPLRTAFTETNNNFTQIFTAGPVGSNIQITNNSISTTNTNGNLVLAPNGIGAIVAAAAIMPDIPGVRMIGSNANPFNTVYSQYIDANLAVFGGNLYVGGNLNVQGNTVTVGYSNLTVSNTNITLANGSSNASQADGAGLLIHGANTGFTYSYGANSWISNIAITADTFIGDGANLSNVIANVNSQSLLGNILSSTVTQSNLTVFGLIANLSASGDISTSGNVYGNVIMGNVVMGTLIGDGANITNISANAVTGNIPYAVHANTALTANLAALATQAINANTALYAINANIASSANTATTAVTANTAHYAIQADMANSAVVAGMAEQLSPLANLSIVGNIITGGYFIGDGRFLSNIVVTTSYGNANVAEYLPTYSGNLDNVGDIAATGNITADYFIGNGSQLTGLPSSYGNSNVTAYLPTYSGNLNNVNNITATGNITGSYIIGNGSQLTGLPAGYSNTNAASFLAAFGSNTISTSGTITADNVAGNNISANGSVSAVGNITANYLIGNGSQLTHINTSLISNGTSYANIASANANLIININNNEWTFGDDAALTFPAQANLAGPGIRVYDDNVSLGTNGGNVSIWPGSEEWVFGIDGKLSAPGDISAVGNINGGIVTFTSAVLANAGATTTTSLIRTNQNPPLGTETYGIEMYTTDSSNPGVYSSVSSGTDYVGLLSSNAGNADIVLQGGYGISFTTSNASGGAVQTWTFEQAGDSLFPGNISTVGNVTGDYFIGDGGLLSNLQVSGSSNVSINGNIAGGNLSTTGRVSATGNIAGGNILTSGLISSTGNIAGGNLSTTGQISATGNIITLGNFVGNGAALTNINVNVAGNIIGTQSNVTLVAGSYSTVFDNTGVATFPGNITTTGNIIGNGSYLSGVAVKTSGAWTLTTGANTVSFTLPGSGTYSLWITGNIPNGIVTYTATVVVTNQNVPVTGTQYGWYYLAGNALVLTSMPNHVVGTAGSISTATASTTTAWTFTFGITNNSGSTQTIYYGWTKLS